MPKSSFKADITTLPKILDFVSEKLKQYNVPQKNLIQSTLSVEEICVSLFEHNTNIQQKQKKTVLQVNNFFGKVSVSIQCPGESFTLFEEKEAELLSHLSSDNDSFVDSQLLETSLRQKLLSGIHSNIRFEHRNGINSVTLTVKERKINNLVLTLISLVSAILFSILLTTVIPHNITQLIDSYFLIPVKTMFFNALKMVVAPLIFFSIISCLSQFSDISEFSRTGGKVLSVFFFTTMLGILIGMAMYFLFSPEGNIDIVSGRSKVMLDPKSLSVISMLIGVIPSNFADAFVKNNVLQIIFLAVLCGIGVNKIGSHAAVLNPFFTACNKLFLAITSIIIKFIPLCIFCCITTFIVNFGAEKLLPLLDLLAAFLVGSLVLFCLYLLVVYAVGHLNPWTFLRSYAKTLFIIFPLSSSVASMPYNIAFCRDDAGINAKLYSFSIPLGTTTNLTGNCLYFGLTTLFCMHLYGIPITVPVLFSLLVSIFIILMGTPGIPGGCIVSMSLLLQQIGVPLDAIGVIMGVEPIFMLLRPVLNSTSFVAVTVAVAGHDNLIDREKFYS